MTCYRIIDTPETSGDELAALIASLPEWRRTAAAAYHHERGKRECAVSYTLLCDLLRDTFGITERPRFAIGGHGKPALLFGDEAEADGNASANIRFNLSHCKQAIACVVSDSAEVGIDVERLGRHTAALADHCMSAEEVRQINNAADPDLEFTMLWTRKEALLKLTGEGITDDLRMVLTSERMKGVRISTQYNKEKGYAWSVAETISH